MAADGTPDRDIEGFPCGGICDPDLWSISFTLCGDGYGDCGYASGICDAVCRVAFLKRSVCRELPEDEKGGNGGGLFEKAETGRIRVTLICYLVLAIAGMFILNPLYGAAAMAGAFLTFGCYYRMAMKNFGGINGDLAGWFLSNCELVMPLFMVAAHLIAAKLG